MVTARRNRRTSKKQEREEQDAREANFSEYQESGLSEEQIKVIQDTMADIEAEAHLSDDKSDPWVNDEFRDDVDNNTDTEAAAAAAEAAHWESMRTATNQEIAEQSARVTTEEFDPDRDVDNIIAGGALEDITPRTRTNTDDATYSDFTVIRYDKDGNLIEGSPKTQKTVTQIDETDEERATRENEEAENDRKISEIILRIGNLKYDDISIPKQYLVAERYAPDVRKAIQYAASGKIDIDQFNTIVQKAQQLSTERASKGESVNWRHVQSQNHVGDNAERFLFALRKHKLDALSDLIDAGNEASEQATKEGRGKWKSQVGKHISYVREERQEAEEYNPDSRGYALNKRARELFDVATDPNAPDERRLPAIKQLDYWFYELPVTDPNRPDGSTYWKWVFYRDKLDINAKQFQDKKEDATAFITKRAIVAMDKPWHPMRDVLVRNADAMRKSMSKNLRDEFDEHLDRWIQKRQPTEIEPDENGNPATKLTVFDDESEAHIRRENAPKKLNKKSIATFNKEAEKLEKLINESTWETSKSRERFISMYDGLKKAYIKILPLIDKDETLGTLEELRVRRQIIEQEIPKIQEAYNSALIKYNRQKQAETALGVYVWTGTPMLQMDKESIQYPSAVDIQASSFDEFIQKLKEIGIATQDLEVTEKYVSQKGSAYIIEHPEDVDDEYIAPQKVDDIVEEAKDLKEFGDGRSGTADPSTGLTMAKRGEKYLNEAIVHANEAIHRANTTKDIADLQLAKVEMLAAVERLKEHLFRVPLTGKNGRTEKSRTKWRKVIKLFEEQAARIEADETEVQKAVKERIRLFQSKNYGDILSDAAGTRRGTKGVVSGSELSQDMFGEIPRGETTVDTDAGKAELPETVTDVWANWKAEKIKEQKENEKGKKIEKGGVIRIDRGSGQVQVGGAITMPTLEDFTKMYPNASPDELMKLYRERSEDKRFITWNRFQRLLEDRPMRETQAIWNEVSGGNDAIYWKNFMQVFPEKPINERMEIWNRVAQRERNISADEEAQQAESESTRREMYGSKDTGNYTDRRGTGEEGAQMIQDYADYAQSPAMFSTVQLDEDGSPYRDYEPESVGKKRGRKPSASGGKKSGGGKKKSPGASDRLFTLSRGSNAPTIPIPSTGRGGRRSNASRGPAGRPTLPGQRK